MNSKTEYQPEYIPRRGEIVAWCGTIAVYITWTVLVVTGTPVPIPIIVLALGLLTSASLISLSNWVDRHTKIYLSSEGISFENGLRHLEYKWDEIHRVQLYPSNWGDKVFIIGQKSHFSFRTLHEVSLDGRIRGRMGFAQGQKILIDVIQKSNLYPIHMPGDARCFERKPPSE